MLSKLRKSVVRITDRPDMTSPLYRVHKARNHIIKLLHYYQAAPVAESVRSLNFGALNHSIISLLCLS